MTVVPDGTDGGAASTASSRPTVPGHIDPDGPALTARAATGTSPRRPLGLIGLTAVVAVLGVVARCWPRSALWLDEAQSVAFARESFPKIPDALRTDGAPPLYYLLLRAWMELAGDGDTMLRTLSVICSVAALTCFFVAVRRLSDERTALVATVVMAANPFTVRYAAETRMYALVTLEVCIGLVLLPAALRRPSAGRLVGLCLVTAALLYTHYWAIYLLAAVGVLLALLLWSGRGASRPAVLRIAAALAAGGVLWLPWLPSFRYQAAHTATPWTTPPKPWEIFDIVLSQAGGHSRPALVIATLFYGAGVLAVWPNRTVWPFRSARQRAGDAPPTAADRRRWPVRLAPRSPVAVPLALVVCLGAMIAVAGAMQSGSALAGRYTSVLLPPLLLLVTLGLTRLRPFSWTVAALVVMTSMAGVLVVREIRSVRTPARQIADILTERAQSGDVVIFCPDQLGPATTRELERSAAPPLIMGTYPDWSSPARVDWVDYTTRYETSSPTAFATEAIERAGANTVWLVWSDTYPPTEPACRNLRFALLGARPAEQRFVQDQPGRHLDHGALMAYPASG